MKIRVRLLGDGLHPSEQIVEIDTLEGPVRLAVDRSYVEDNSLDIGYPITRINGRMLVELPRETPTGEWRVWVARNSAVDEPALEDAR